MDSFCYLCFLSVILSFLFGHLLGKGCQLGSLVSDAFLCFGHFPMWCPGSGVVHLYLIVSIPDRKQTFSYNLFIRILLFEIILNMKTLGWYFNAASLYVR